MDSETLTSLLRGHHLSMPDRIARGLWPHPALHLSEITDHLARVLEHEKWFPMEFVPHQEGRFVDERGSIEKQGADRFVYRCQGSHPVLAATLTRSTERVFSNSHAAAAHYLKWEMNLPGDLDGWKVVE